MAMSNILTLLKKEEPKCTKNYQSWDYIYSKDLARALRLIGEKGKDGAIYCIGSGEASKVKDFIFAKRDEINKNLEVGIGEMNITLIRLLCT